IWRSDGEALGKVEPPASSASGAYTLDPAFLDACSRVLAAALPSGSPDGARRFYWPAGFSSLQVDSAVTQAAWSHARVSRMGSEIEGDISVYGMDGRPLFHIGGLRLRSMDDDLAPERAADYQLYRRRWIADPERASPVAPTGEWLVVADRRGVAEQCASLIVQAGGSCRVVAGEESVECAWPRHIVYLRGCGAETFESAAHDLLLLMQRLARGPAGATKLWIATSGAMRVVETDTPNPVEASLWGIGRTAAVEHAEFWGGLVDLDPASEAEASARALLETVLGGGQQDMLAWRGGNRYIARLRKDLEVERPGAPLAFPDDATYLITGGTGGLGLRLMRWLLERGARHIALAGRRPASTNLPPEVRFLRADVASERETVEALDKLRRSMPPLRGVFHLAGTLDDGLLESQDWVRFAKSTAGKMDGAWNLHRATLGGGLDYFVMFSSMASLVP
ncbi:MAG: SDR family NAD(P)-dependent oxidoreductase, partial [Bryobacteraceae bacterium]